MNPALTRRRAPEVTLMTDAEVAKMQQQQRALRNAKNLYGPPLWAELHLRYLSWPLGVDDSAWLAAFASRVPCGECRNHWRQMTEENPPDWMDPFAWSVARHNQVAQRLDKPQLDVTAARLHWSGMGSAKPAQTVKSCAPCGSGRG